MNNCHKKIPRLMAEDLNWNAYLESLYDFYKTTFVDRPIIHKGLPLKTFTNLDYNLKQATFTHLTTQGSDDRTYNAVRCQLLPLLHQLVTGDCDDCGEHLYFPDLDWKKENKRYIVWCQPLDYVAVIERRKDSYFIITAYVLNYAHKKEQLEKKHQKYLNAKNARN